MKCYYRVCCSYAFKVMRSTSIYDTGSVRMHLRSFPQYRYFILHNPTSSHKFIFNSFLSK